MSCKYQAKSGFLKRKIAGEVVLVPVGAASKEFNGMIMLNETGSYMWDLLKESVTKEQLISAMLEEFEAESDVIAADVDEFLENGVKEGLISCM